MNVALPLITVLGATGAQGSAVVRALLADPYNRCSVRALTRQPASPAAQALAAAGAQVHAADLDDPASLRRAFAGSHGVFAATNFWEHLSPEREGLQARNIASAAREARVRHIVWSTREDTRRWVPLDDERLPTLMGQYKVPHFDAKGAADACFQACGVPTTRLYGAYFWDNLLLPGLGLLRQADGGLVYALPMDEALLPGIAADDLGACVAAIFLAGDEYLGRCVGLAAEHLSGAQMAQALAAALGEPVRHVSPSAERYAAHAAPGAACLANMFSFKRLFNADFCARRPLQQARMLHPAVQGFEGWLRGHARSLLPVAAAQRQA